MSERISVKLLTDNPATIDEFSGRPHERIASAIAELIAHNPGGRAIGLDGGWGSGKSTVVELITKMLEDHQSEDGTPGTSRASILQNVWLIVPFDRDQIAAVFSDDTIDDSKQVRGFIEKTFFITLRVAPPLLSAYREYFLSKLDSVFEAQITDDERESVFQLFDMYVSTGGIQLTPRAIKAFINAFAMQVQQWGRIIPIAHHALYIIYQDSRRKHSEDIR